MCMFCAAIPSAAAVGVRLEAQQRKQAMRPRPIRALTIVSIGFLLAGSILYHTLTFRQ